MRTDAHRNVLVAEPYIVFGALASGGMGAVHLGSRVDPGSPALAIKRLHAHYQGDPDFVEMFLDEARIAARIRHPNVVATIDVLDSAEGLLIVMEYVHGEALGRLLKQVRVAGEKAPNAIVARIVHGALLGLHAAHGTRDDEGALLGVVHRDVCPQNILVGADGRPKMVDFGVAKAAGRAQVTRQGQIKGKLAYMAPEQVRGAVDCRADIFGAGVVLWEALAGRRLHEGLKEVDLMRRVVAGELPPPSAYAPDIPPDVDALVLRALAPDPARRFATAAEMADELAGATTLASADDVGAWVRRIAGETLARRSVEIAANVRACERLRGRGLRGAESPSTTLRPAFTVQLTPLLQRRGVLVAAALAAATGVLAGAYLSSHRRGVPRSIGSASVARDFEVRTSVDAGPAIVPADVTGAKP